MEGVEGEEVEMMKTMRIMRTRWVWEEEGVRSVEEETVMAMEMVVREEKVVKKVRVVRVVILQEELQAVQKGTTI